ncbi:MAG: site-2 protease family protein [Actinomycetota bacterium]
MDESFRIARIAGIRVGMNWSLLLVFWLIAWSLAAQRFPSEFPGYEASTYWIAGALTAIVFFASLLAHEMAHALVARRHGVEVDGITLWLFGGVARLRGEAMTPRAELRIAIVGPIMSLAIAAAAAILGWLLDAASAPDLLAGVVKWLARINAVLAVFNMVPAFPLDGGRVLRGWLWKRRGRTSATVSAARAGRGFGYLLIGLGLVEFALRAQFGGLWFVFLGWFLLNAARMEESHVLLRGALSDVQVRDVMARDPVTAPGWLTVEAFVESYALQHRFATFPLLAFDGTLDGLVTLSRIKQVPADERGSTRVRDIAEPMSSVPTARPDEPLVDALSRMQGSDGRALVMQDGELVGILSPRDVARALDVASLRGAPVPEHSTS